MRKTQIAPDFKVKDRMVVLAKENGWPLPDKEVAGFIDYHLAHGSTMADWDAAFRTWLRNAAKWKNGNGAQVIRTVDPKPIRRREDRPKEEPRDPKVKELLTGLIKGMD